MLDRLRGGEQAGIERGRILVLRHDLLAFIEDALDGIAFLAARGLAEQLEDFLEPLDLPLGLVVVLLECRAKLVDLAALAILGRAL